jgi:hypothetical protein
LKDQPEDALRIDVNDTAFELLPLHAMVEINPIPPERFLRELARLFLADCPLHLAEIEEAIRPSDALALGRAAHKLKGSIGNFAAKNSSEICSGSCHSHPTRAFRQLCRPATASGCSSYFRIFEMQRHANGTSLGLGMYRIRSDLLL